MPKSKKEFEQMLTREEMEAIRRTRTNVRKLKQHTAGLNALGNQAMTTKEFAEKMKLYRATAYALLKELECEQLVVRRYGKKNLLSYWMRK